jgi:hypothetical protein
MFRLIIKSSSGVTYTKFKSVFLVLLRVRKFLQGSWNFPLLVGSTWRRRQNPVSKTSYDDLLDIDKTMDNVQKRKICILWQ